MNLNNTEIQEKFSEALKVLLGADYVNISTSANRMGYDIGIAFRAELDFRNTKPEREVLEAIETRLKNTPAFTRLVSDLQAENLNLTEKVKQLESKVETLEPYKIFYDLYKGLNK